MDYTFLKVFSQNDAAREVVSLHLVEVSPHLSQLQELKLCGTVSVVKDVLEADDSRRHLHLHTNHDNDEMMYKHNITKHGVPVSWYRNLEDVPEGFSCMIAYELFDAFPIHKLQVSLIIVPSVVKNFMHFFMYIFIEIYQKHIHC